MHPADHAAGQPRTAEEVREALAAAPMVKTVFVLLDDGRASVVDDRPQTGSCSRSPAPTATRCTRNRSAKTAFGDKPRVIPIGASVFDVLDVLGGGGPGAHQTDDVRGRGTRRTRCIGVVPGGPDLGAAGGSADRPRVEQAAAPQSVDPAAGSESINPRGHQADQRRRGCSRWAGWTSTPSNRSTTSSASPSATGPESGRSAACLRGRDQTSTVGAGRPRRRGRTSCSSPALDDVMQTGHPG